MAGYEIVISVVQFLTLLALLGTLRLHRSDFKTRTRPYIGFIDIIRKDTRKAKEIEFDVMASNVSSLPAKNAKLYGKFIANDKDETPFECETKGSVFPSSVLKPTWIIGIKDIDEDEILNGSKILRLDMTVEYYGSGKERYWTTTNRIYDAQRDRWIKEEGNWA